MHTVAALLRGQDSNLGPTGYEPVELPLLHPAQPFYARRELERAQRLPKKNAIQRATRDSGEIERPDAGALACASRCTTTSDSLGPM